MDTKEPAWKRELAMHADHLKYGDLWERMMERVNTLFNEQGIDTKSHYLEIGEIAGLLCQLKSFRLEETKKG